MAEYDIVDLTLVWLEEFRRELVERGGYTGEYPAPLHYAFANALIELGRHDKAAAVEILDEFTRGMRSRQVPARTIQ